jgi:hypothetical protein
MCQHKFEGPPSLSAKVIRNLGEKFCNLSEVDLSDKALKKKKNPTGYVGPKKPGKKDKDDKKQDSVDEDKCWCCSGWGDFAGLCFAGLFGCFCPDEFV